MSSSKSESSSPVSSFLYQVVLVFGFLYFLSYIVAECLLLIFKIHDSIFWIWNHLCFLAILTSAMWCVAEFYFFYPLGNFLSELALLFILFGIESIRIFIGKKGNLTERPFSIILSLLLTVPVTCGVTYLFWWQTYVLMIDVVISIFLFIFIGMQTLFAIFTLISFGRSVISFPIFMYELLSKEQE